MNSSVIVCDIIFLLMRIMCKSSIYIVKNKYVQQAVGGVAVGVLILGTWVESHSKFFDIFFKINEFIYQ